MSLFCQLQTVFEFIAGIAFDQQFSLLCFFDILKGIHESILYLSFTVDQFNNSYFGQELIELHNDVNLLLFCQLVNGLIIVFLFFCLVLIWKVSMMIVFHRKAGSFFHPKILAWVKLNFFFIYEIRYQVCFFVPSIPNCFSVLDFVEELLYILYNSSWKHPAFILRVSSSTNHIFIIVQKL